MKKRLAPGVTLGFHHWHEGNDKDRKIRGRSPYATTATIKNEETGVILAVGIARCSKRDNPSRKVGREVAGGRALKAWQALAINTEAT